VKLATKFRSNSLRAIAFYYAPKTRPTAPLVAERKSLDIIRAIPRAFRGRGKGSAVSCYLLSRGKGGGSAATLTYVQGRWTLGEIPPVPCTLPPYLGLRGARRKGKTVLEPGENGLSNDISFIYVGRKAKKLLKVKFNNLVILSPISYLAFKVLIIARVTFEFPVSSVLVFLMLCLFPV